MKTPRFVLVKGGTFTMGNPEDAKWGPYNPVHSVTLSDFLMAETPVTQRLYAEVMGTNPSWFLNQLDNPVEGLSWADAVAFCNAMSLRHKLKPCYSGEGDDIACNWQANGYRLPTEAEWEYAAGGGASPGRTRWAGTDDEARLKEFAWYADNAEGKTHPVRQKKPNRLGLYDMSGNVWEMCWDWDYPYSPDAQVNPVGPAVRGRGQNRVFRTEPAVRGLGHGRIVRGGPFSRKPYQVTDRYAWSEDYARDIGFRLVRSV